MPAYFDKGLMVGKTAWHEGGTNIPADDPRRFDIEECLKLADMDDTIHLGRCFFYLDDVDGEPCAEVEGQLCTVREYSDGTFRGLGAVGARYKPFQPRQQFEFMQPWLETHELAIETAGTLEGGKVDWVLAKILRGNIDLGGGDEISKYLLVSNEHTGRQAIHVGFTPVRVECANLLRMAHGHAESKLLKVRHTKSQDIAMATIRETIELIDQEFAATAEQYRTMMRCKVSMADLRAYVKLVNGIDPETSDKAISGKIRNRINDMVRFAVSGMGQSPSELTVWSGYSGVTQFLSHNYAATNEKRLVSLLKGTANQMNQRAFELAMQLSA